MESDKLLEQEEIIQCQHYRVWWLKEWDRNTYNFLTSESLPTFKEKQDYGFGGLKRYSWFKEEDKIFRIMLDYFLDIFAFHQPEGVEYLLGFL